MRNPLVRLVHRDPAKPSLRQRAAALKASATKVMRRRQLGSSDVPIVMPSLAPGVLPSGEMVVVDVAEMVARALEHANPAPANSSAVAALIEGHRAARVALDAAAKATDSIALRRAGFIPAAEEMARREVVLNTASDAEQTASDKIVQHVPSNATEAALLLRYLADEPNAIDPDEIGTALRNVAKAVVNNLDVDAAFGGPAAPASLAADCDALLARLAWLDQGGNSDSFSEEEWTAEMDRWGAVFRRAIDEPSTRLGDLAAKARLMLADLDRFKPLETHGSDDYRLMRTILSEAIRLPSAFLDLSSDDVALLALEAEFLAADAVVIAANKARNEARDRYVEPAMPIQLNPWRGDWMHTAIPRTRSEAVGDGRCRSLPYGAEEVEQMRGRRCLRHSYGDDGELQPDGRRMMPDVKVQERVDAIVAAWDQWQEAIQTAKDAAGIDKSRDAVGRAKEHRASVLERIRDTPARTMAGLGVKARIAASMNAVEDMKEEAREYDPDQPEALPYDIAGDVLSILATSLKSEGTTTTICKPADPVFSTIERYQTARDIGAAFSKRIELEGIEAMGGFDVVNEEDTRLAREWSRLATEVLETAPSTEAGRLALAAFIEMWVNDHGNLDGSPQDGSETVFAEVYPTLLMALRASVAARD